VKPKERQKQNDADFISWLTTSQGRRLYVRIITQAGLWSSSYVESPTGTAYNEGRRGVALALLTEAQRVCPELHATALREQLNMAAIEATTPTIQEE
jgi:hypothetical protein